MSMGVIRSWITNVLVAADQLVNAVLGGDPDETISSRAAKAARRGHRWGCVLCRALDALQRDHCERVIETDEGRFRLRWQQLGGSEKSDNIAK
jgi:hypothetical protein